MSLRGVSRRFGKNIANDDVDLEVRSGTVHAVVGENGAGKSTLMKIAYGQIRADAGTMYIKDKAVPLARHSPVFAIEHGVGLARRGSVLEREQQVAACRRGPPCRARSRCGAVDRRPPADRWRTWPW